MTGQQVCVPHAQVLSHFQLFVTPWAVAHQASLSMGFSNQEYWSEKKKKNTGVGCHALLQGIFPTQGSNPYLLCPLNWQAGSSATWEAFSKCSFNKYMTFNF